MSSELTVYTTSWCPYCRALKRQLGELGLEFTEIDIDADAAAAQIVQSLNNGNRTVPTVVFSDGSTLTNPSGQAVAARLAQLG